MPDRARRSFQFRLKTTRRQSELLSAFLLQLCELYNMCLEQRRYQRIGYYEQQKQLRELRTLPEYAHFPAGIQREPLRRVDRAFKGFFRRCRSGQKPGYPRFRSRDRYDSFSADSQNLRVDGNRLSIAKLGSFRIKTRCRVRGVPKELRVKRLGAKWVASIVYELGPIPVKVAVSKAIGIDVGLTSLATLSDGSDIKNPRWTQKAAERLAEASRRLSQKQRGSMNRLKCRELVRRLHRGIAGRRTSYLHGISRRLVDSYDLIAFEKLKVGEMVRGSFGKSILDAAWRELIEQIQYKAEWAGKWAVPVEPRGTTQLCSGCGTTVPKGLRQRVHDCPQCGLVLGRDHNAALNILERGERSVGIKPAGCSA